MKHRVAAPLRLSLLLSVPVWCAFLPSAAQAAGACTTDASGNATCSGGTITTPLVIYDAAAQVQPPANGSNSYAIPANYNQNPPTVFVTVDPTATMAITTTSATAKTALADNGIIVANYSNSEDPAVNNVVVNNSGTVALTTNQIGQRNHAIVSDSQVNMFTVNNMAGGVISATQNYAPFLAFNKNLLTAQSSNTAPPSPSTYSPKYAGNTLSIVSALYSDDNTNTFVLNNDATVQATGRFAAGYYGRAATTITNTGTLGNAGWAATDHIYDGHWAIGTYAGANFATLAGSNPDTPIYDVQNINTNAQGVYQGTIAVTDTAATAITNAKSGTINGDILVLDTNPLVYAAAMATSPNSIPLAVSGSNSGPRDSAIDNYGAINGSFYLGSGNHQITNESGATIAGSINVDQRPSVGVFAAAVPGSTPGTYTTAGNGTTDSNGNPCPASGNTTDPYCAKTRNVLASFVGGQTFNLKNSGTIAGDITINDQATSVNKITLVGTGFSGNVVAVNGSGSNTLTLNGVTNLQSVQNFSTLNLRQSNVAVANGVSLVDGATIRTNVYGPAGTRAAPSTQLGTINGALTLQGATTLVPTFATFVQNGVYQVASSVTAAGPVTVEPSHSALVSAKADTSDGRLLLETHVRSAYSIGGLNQPATATLNALLTYRGDNPEVRALAARLEKFGTLAQVRDAANALAPNTNGADIQTPINDAMMFHQQIDSRLDNFLYGELPVSGRSADLGVPRPVYAVVPANGAWAEAIGGGVHQSTVDQVNGYNAELEGVIGGYDRLIAPGFRIGGAFGYIDTRINNGTNLGSREDIQTYQGLGYAAYEGSHVYLRGSAGYGAVDYEGVRRIAFDSFSDNAYGTHSGNIFTARGEGGVPYEYRNSLLVPYAAFTYSHLMQDAYSETSGSGTAFNYRSASNDSDRSEVGGKIIVPLGGAPVFSYLFPAGSIVALEGRAAYVHEFGNVAQTVAASFTGGGDVFIASGPVPNRDMVDYGVGLRMASGPVQIDLSYNGLARSSYLQQVGLLRARYLF